MHVNDCLLLNLKHLRHYMRTYISRLIDSNSWKLRKKQILNAENLSFYKYNHGGELTCYLRIHLKKKSTAGLITFFDVLTGRLLKEALIDIFCVCRGPVASRLVRSSPDRQCLSPPRRIDGYRLGVTLRWTSIPSRGK